MEGRRRIGIQQCDCVAYEIASTVLTCGNGYIEADNVKVYLRPMERMLLDRLLEGGAGGCPVSLLIEDLDLPMTANGKGTLQSHIYNLRARLALVAPDLTVATSLNNPCDRLVPEPRFAAATQSCSLGGSFDGQTESP